MLTMLRWPMVATFLVVASLTPAARGEGWTSSYRRGLKALQAGRLEVARRALEDAVAANPRPEATARSYGSRTLPYLPYVHLAAVAYGQDDLESAERWIARSLGTSLVTAARSDRVI